MAVQKYKNEVNIQVFSVPHWAPLHMETFFSCPEYGFIKNLAIEGFGSGWDN
jgi:hypothetical protein